MPDSNSYIPDALDAIEEISESSDDAFYVESTEQSKSYQHEIHLEPMVQEEISLPGTLSFGMPATIMEEEDEDDDSCCDSIEPEGKENLGFNSSFGKEASGSLSRKLSLINSQRQLHGQVSVSDFETGSVARFDFDDSGSDDGTLLRSDQSSLSISHSVRGSDDDDEPLTWRLDPSESLSDWSICVHDIQSNTSNEYHVHRNMLAVGKRKSAFFVDLFKRRQSHTTTEFYFCKDAASSVPMVLDWIYVGDSAITLSSESAPGLRYLAQCFGLRKLFDQTMAFMRSNLSAETLATYYLKAVAMEDQKILNVVARYFARKIEIIDTDNEIMDVMKPSFFLNILSQPGLDRPETTVHKTVMISSYCEKHKSTLTEEVFLLLTNEAHLAQVHYGAALQFFHLELELAPKHTTRVNQDNDPTSLQTRCIDAIAPRWKEVVELHKEAMQGLMERLPSFIATKIMMQALEFASLDFDKQASNAKIEASALRKRVKARVKSSYGKKIQQLNETCKQKDEEIEKRNQELARFTRLPKSFDGRLIASRSSTKPLSMPLIGDHEEEGYILTGRKLGGVSFPIFYYK